MFFDAIGQARARCVSFLRNVFRRPKVERELDAELNAYLDLLIEENLRHGMHAAEARRHAQLTVGGVTQVKEQMREVQAGASFESVLQDIRYARRAFRRSPSFFVVATLTLALGIGFATALFSIVNAVILRPLPYSDANRLMFLGAGNKPGEFGYVSYPDFRDWRSRNRSFEYIAAYGDGDAGISTGESATRVHIAVVTQDFFKIFAAYPERGRDFSPAEHRPGSTPVVIVADSLWRGKFGSTPDIIGRTLYLLGGVRCTIIGVMPPGFDFPSHTQVWSTAEVTNGGLEARTAHNFQVVGKLRPGVPPNAAQRDLSAIEHRIKAQFPGTYQTGEVAVMPLVNHLAGPFKRSLLTLFAAVGFVLLIVCVNVANLLLARSTARAHELAIRSALGAARKRLFRQLIIESLALAIAGGAAGLLLAWWTLHILHYVVPMSIPRIETVSLDGHVLAFATLVSLISGLVLGVVPAFTATRPDVAEALKQASTQHSGTRATRKIGNLLVVSEVGLAFMLLIGTGLLVRSFVHLQEQPAGFDPRNVLTAALDFPINSFDVDTPPPDRLNNYLSIAARLSALPGVRAVGYTSALPLTNDPRDGHFFVEGMADLPGFLSDANYRVVSADYFRAIGASITAGRFFSANDGAGSMPVVIINSAMAKKVFPQGRALGRRIWFDSFDPERRFMTIVGIVKDIREEGLNQPVQPTGYVLYLQHPLQCVDTNLVVHVATSDVMRFAPAIRNIIHSVNKNVPSNFETLITVYQRSIARQRFETQMLSLFAALAILLAGIGIYGVLSYLVQQTRREIGIRMALGASPPSILLRIVSRGLRVAFIGVLAGLPCILAIAKILSAMLFHTQIFDPFTYLSAGILLLGVVLIASYVPARRATRIDPLTTLKFD